MSSAVSSLQNPRKYDGQVWHPPSWNKTDWNLDSPGTFAENVQLMLIGLYVLDIKRPLTPFALEIQACVERFYRRETYIWESRKYTTGEALPIIAGDIRARLTTAAAFLRASQLERASESLPSPQVIQQFVLVHDYVTKWLDEHNRRRLEADTDSPAHKMKCMLAQLRKLLEQYDGLTPS